MNKVLHIISNGISKVVELSLLTLVLILSIPVASISFFIAVQINAWRFGKEIFRVLINKSENPFA